MQIVIEIDEEIYKGIKMGMRNRDDMAEIGEAVENGIPLPTGHERKALEQDELYDFVKWVATEIFDDYWEFNKDAFAELACRKLAKLGIVKANGDKWELIEPQESEVSDETCD